MKKASILMTVLVLTLSVMAGCGCRNSAPANTSEPTTMPTVTIAPTTEETTMPTTMATIPSTDATIEDGNGPISTDATTETDDTGSADARSRSGGMAGGNTGSGITGGAGSGNGITGSITRSKQEAH